ncbi:MAG: hypothetical protein M3Z17_08335 [Gemmatimonadota bacterium]|nr:hypothetical protein [Gemmatimonadota bacterium]
MTDTRPEMESIRIRLLKVLRLAQEGVGGERENAEVMLEKLLRKHSMTMADLDGALDQPRTCAWLPVGDGEERAVLSQLVVKLFGVERKVWRRGSDVELGVDVTAAEGAALEIAWEVYRAAFAEARRALVMGFCFKHGLYAAEGAANSEMSAEEREGAARALKLAEALPVVDAPGRRLESGDESR